jgi:hypothetical protein
MVCFEQTDYKSVADVVVLQKRLVGRSSTIEVGQQAAAFFVRVDEDVLVVCEEFVLALFFLCAMMVEEWEILRKLSYPSDSGHDPLLVYNFYKLVRQQTHWQGQHPQFINFVTKSVKQFYVLAPMVRYKVHKYMQEWHQLWCSFLIEKNGFFELCNLLANPDKKFGFFVLVSFAQGLILLEN